MQIPTYKIMISNVGQIRGEMLVVTIVKIIFL